MYAQNRLTSDQRVKIASIQESDIGATFAIGNAWQWENFQIGCDWIGVHLPAIYLQKKYSNENVDLTSADSVERRRNYFRNTATMLNVQGLRFYLGAAF